MHLHKRHATAQANGTLLRSSSDMERQRQLSKQQHEAYVLRKREARMERKRVSMRDHTQAWVAKKRQEKGLSPAQEEESFGSDESEYEPSSDEEEYVAEEFDMRRGRATIAGGAAVAGATSDGLATVV